MRKIISILVFVSLFASCSFFIEDEVTLNIPSAIALENLTGESIYYTLTYFDGESVRSFYVPSHVRKVNVNVKKGYLSLFLLYPANTFTPLSAFREPGGESIEFSYSKSSIIEFMMDAAKEEPAIIANLSLSALFSKYSGDDISKSKFLSALEKGKLNFNSDIKQEKKEIKVENLASGRWYSDRDDIIDIVVPKAADYITLNLYEGVYIFIHEDLDLMATIAITEEGKSVSNISRFAAWY